MCKTSISEVAILINEKTQKEALSYVGPLDRKSQGEKPGGRGTLSRKSSFTVGKGGWFYMSEDKWEAAGKNVEATGKKIQQVGARSHF